MPLAPATPADYPEIVRLANQAYRNNANGWTSEAGVIDGLRLTMDSLRADLAAKPNAHLLLLREEPAGPLLGTVWLEPQPSGTTWYLGLLTIDPSLQNRQLGRTLLAAAEDFAKSHGATNIRMTVLNVRHTLLAWYERRGYHRTGESHPFPYGNDRFGTPLRDDLAFLALEKPL